MTPFKRRVAVVIPYACGLLAFAVTVHAQSTAATPQPYFPDFTQIGFGGVVGYLIYWMTTKLSASVDKLTDRIGDMIDRQDRRDGAMDVTLREQAAAFRVMTEAFKQLHDDRHAERQTERHR